MLNLLLLTAATWTAISMLFVWRLASAIPPDSGPPSARPLVDAEAPVSPRAPAPLKKSDANENKRTIFSASWPIAEADIARSRRNDCNGTQRSHRVETAGSDGKLIAAIH